MKPNDAARTFTPQRLHSAVLQIAPQFKVTGTQAGAPHVFCRRILSKAEKGVHRVPPRIRCRVGERKTAMSC